MELKDELQRRFGDRFFVIGKNDPGYDGYDADSLAEFEQTNGNYEVPIGNAQMRDGREVKTQKIQRFRCEDIFGDVWLVEKSWYITVCRDEFWTGDGTSTCVDNALKFWDIADAEKEIRYVKKAYPKLSDDEIEINENL